MFSHLPCELIAQVFGYFDPLSARAPCQSTLYSLSLTCRIAHDIANPLLFKHIDFDLLGANPAYRHIRLFLRSCFENKGLLDDIQSASLRVWTYHAWDDLQALAELLLNAPRLTKLSVSPLFVDSNQEQINYLNEATPVLMLSPKQLSQLVLPVQDKLTELVVSDKGDMKVEHDRTVLSLANFANLKALTLSNACLFGGYVAGDAEISTAAHALPLALERLTISFPRNEGIFYTLGEMKTALLVGMTVWEQLWRERTNPPYADNSHGLQTASGVLLHPTLCSLTLAEENNCGWRGRFTKVVRWRKGEIQRDSGKKLSFVIDLRVPERWHSDYEVLKYWTR